MMIGDGGLLFWATQYMPNVL